MTNEELILKIKAEIERRITDNTFGAKLELIDILAWLDTLESEKPVPNDLAEEVKRYYSDNFEYLSSDQPTLSILTNIARHFAQWQKQQMMKEAVAVQVVGEQRDLRLIDSTQRCLFNAKRGDWLKIIIVKEEEK